MAEAREATTRGDAEAAKRALEHALRSVATLERSRESLRSMSRVADGASALDRSLHAATMTKGGEPGPGRDGDDGEPGPGRGAERRGTSKASAEKASVGPPAGGPGGSDRTSGPEQRKVRLSGDLKARTDVREGDRAVSAIEGMGHGGDPRAYREIFPSYDTA